MTRTQAIFFWSRKAADSRHAFEIWIKFESAVFTCEETNAWTDAVATIDFDGKYGGGEI